MPGISMAREFLEVISWGARSVIKYSASLAEGVGRTLKHPAAIAGGCGRLLGCPAGGAGGSEGNSRCPAEIAAEFQPVSNPPASLYGAIPPLSSLYNSAAGWCVVLSCRRTIYARASRSLFHSCNCRGKVVGAPCHLSHCHPFIYQLEESGRGYFQTSRHGDAATSLKKVA